MPCAFARRPFADWPNFTKMLLRILITPFILWPGKKYEKITVQHGSSDFYLRYYFMWNPGDLLRNEKYPLPYSIPNVFLHPLSLTSRFSWRPMQHLCWRDLFSEYLNQWEPKVFGVKFSLREIRRIFPTKLRTFKLWKMPRELNSRSPEEVRFFF